MRYEDLPEGARDIADLIMSEFGDLFDNDQFGPFVEEFTPFGADRIADLMDVAMGNLALLVKVQVSWTIDTFPYTRPVPRAALRLSLTVELIRHLIRTYVEIPNISSVGAPIADRRDYLERWKGVLDDYKRQLEDAAKRLEGDLYNDEAGRYTKVLASYPRATGMGYGLPMAERPSYGFWWD